MDFARPDARCSCVTNDLLTHVGLLEADISLLADVIATVLGVAVCDHCQHRWFVAKPVAGVAGTAAGVLTSAGACCSPCVNEAAVQIFEKLDDEARALAERQGAVWRRKHPRGPTQSESLTFVTHHSQRQRNHALHPDLPSNGSARWTRFSKTTGGQHDDDQ
jgi:hypothetical protein